MDNLKKLDFLLKNPTGSAANHIKEVEAIFFSLPTIDQQLPVQISGGQNKVNLTVFVMHCLRCRRELDCHQVRGQVSQLLSHVASIAIFSYCKTCNLIASNSARVRADGSINYLTRKGWVTIEQPPHLSFIAKLTSFVLRFFQS